VYNPDFLHATVVTSTEPTLRFAKNMGAAIGFVNREFVTIEAVIGHAVASLDTQQGKPKALAKFQHTNASIYMMSAVSQPSDGYPIS
jgi:hypothetical protein